MKNLIEQFNPFKKPTALEIAVHDLEQAEKACEEEAADIRSEGKGHILSM